LLVQQIHFRLNLCRLGVECCCLRIDLIRGIVRCRGTGDVTSFN